MAFCGKEIEVYVESGFGHKAINVRCGNTSPTGYPWMCEACEATEGHRDFRREAEDAGERWDEDY